MDAGLFQSLIGRLRTLIVSSHMSPPLSFQSLIGRLRTEAPMSGVWLMGWFQSLIGRLRTVSGDAAAADVHHVSIPYR